MILDKKFTSAAGSLSQKAALPVAGSVDKKNYKNITGQPTETLVCCAKFHQINFILLQLKKNWSWKFRISRASLKQTNKLNPQIPTPVHGWFFYLKTLKCVCAHSRLQSSHGVKHSNNTNKASLDLIHVPHFSTEEHSGLHTIKLSSIHAILNSPCNK